MPSLRSPTRFHKILRLISLLVIAAFLYGAYWVANKYIPPQHLPWKPLDINADIGFATKTQLFKMAIAPHERCVTSLTSNAQQSVLTVPDAKNGQGACGWELAVEARLTRDIDFSPPDVTTLCPLAAANYIWIGQVDSAAREVLRSSLKRIHHYGTYSCRNIANSTQLSEHAYANAWDVHAFELADGRLISIQKHWDARGNEAKFLRVIRDEACGLYRVVLSPDYNAAHADHFHLDMGPSSTCR